MTGETLIYLGILVVCTAASGFFSGSETALIGISRERVHMLSEESTAGRKLEQLIAEPDRMLSTLLVANNAVNVLSASVATLLFISLLGASWGPWVATVVMTAVLLVFGEITPKTIAARHPERVSLAVAPTIWNLSKVLAPIASFFSAITRGLLRVLRIRPDGDGDGVTDDDIRALARLGERGGHIEAAEREIIDALFHLDDRAVREVMTPRPAIVSLTIPLTALTVREAVTETGHSRFPVTNGDLDDLIGVIAVKDLLLNPEYERAPSVERLLRKPNYVPETMSILDTLSEMRANRYGMAVVVDEHGGVEGIVTIKDLVSELVGELKDEYDPGAPSLIRLGPRLWMADGMLDVQVLGGEVEVDLGDGPYSTVGGFVMTALGRIPDEGDVHDEDGVRFTVVAMDRQRIDSVKVERLR
ncbi:MAG: HlyC/CorC family transporter [Acidimicrobiia bacterium]|nr:HlyC/CorC family transporter [Acidimicrobiia bacterium]